MKVTRGSGPEGSAGATGALVSAAAPRAKFERTLLFALAVGLGWGCGAGGATSSSLGPDGGDTVTDSAEAGAGGSDGPMVAQLSFTRPESDHMIVRGTIPVPPGMVVDGDSTDSLAVVPWDLAHSVATQVETVTRYPDEADGADVVEVLAHVRMPQDSDPGETVKFDVVYAPRTPERLVLPPSVETLMDAPGALRLVAHDPHGHRYEADLLAAAEGPNAELVRDGSVVRETRIPTVLLPTEPTTGPAATLPRMMGVTAFLRLFRRQDYFAIDLHVHNAFDGQDDSVDWDTSIDSLYFQDLSLRLPRGWKVLHAFENPFSGPAREVGNMQEAHIVGPLPGGKMHLMHKQSQFSRRLIITRESSEDLARVELERRNLGFCVQGESPDGAQLWSWWNRTTPRFLPQNHVLPDLSEMTSRGAVDGEAGARLAQRLQQLRNGSAGSYPATEPALGWAHPYGVAYGGMTGGDQIEQVPGVDVAWSASQNAYRLVELQAKMNLERQPYALISSNGQPTRIEDHVNPEGNHGSWVDWNMNMTFSNGEGFFFAGSPDHQAEHVEFLGLQPDYEDRLRAFQPIDLQHLIRYTRNLLTMTWLGNDSLAKLQLKQTAELFRMTHHEHFVGNYGYVHGLSLKQRQVHVEQHPGIGVSYGRGEGWGLFATVAAYAIGDDDLRQRHRPWLAEIARTIRRGQSTCTGNITAVRISRHLDGRYYTRQSFEHSFVINALESMRRTVFEGVDDEVEGLLRDSVVDAAYSTVTLPFWDPAFGGHMKVTGVGMTDHSVPDFCSNLPDDSNYGMQYVDHETPMPTWTFAYQLTGDPIFLQRATSSIGVTGNLEAELNLLGVGKLPHSATLLGLLQSRGSPQ